MKRKRPGLPKWIRRSRASSSRLRAPYAAKQRGQREHAVRRAAERFGLHLSAEDYDALVQAIQTGQTRFLFRESLRLSHHAICVQGAWCRVVYDARRKTIVTFLPLEPDALKENA